MAVTEQWAPGLTNPQTWRPLQARGPRSRSKPQTRGEPCGPQQAAVAWLPSVPPGLKLLLERPAPRRPGCQGPGLATGVLGGWAALGCRRQGHDGRWPQMGPLVPLGSLTPTPRMGLLEKTPRSWNRVGVRGRVGSLCPSVLPPARPGRQRCTHQAMGGGGRCWGCCQGRSGWRA